MAAFLPDSLVQAKAMEASEDDVHMETKDVPANCGRAVMNGEMEQNGSKEEAMEVDMAEDEGTAGNGKANKDFVEEPASSPGKIGYLTLTDGCLMLKTAGSETSTENNVVNGCGDVEEAKEKNSDSELSNKVALSPPHLSKTENSSDEVRNDSCESEKNGSLTDSCGASSSSSHLDADLKIHSPETVNPSASQASDPSSPEVKEPLNQQSDPAPAVSSPDSLEQGSSVEEEKRGDSCSVDSVGMTVHEAGSVDVSPNDRSAAAESENNEKSPLATVATEEHTDAVQNHQSPSEVTSVSDQTETVIEKEGAEEKGTHSPCSESENKDTEVSVSAEPELTEQPAVDVKDAEQSEKVDDAASSAAQQDIEPVSVCEAETVSVDSASSSGKPEKEETSECKASVEEASAHTDSNACKSDEVQESVSDVKSDHKPDTQSLPPSLPENNQPATETCPSQLPSSSQPGSATTDTSEKTLPRLTTSKATARKSVPGGSSKSKLAKGTARKTGQPQSLSKITYSDKDPNDGTIKIFNLHPNSNITLKLSELEKVLKPPKPKEASRVNMFPSAESVVKKEKSVAVNKELYVDVHERSPSLDTSTSDTSPVLNSADDASGSQSSLKMQHRRRRKKGGTYDFPGGKKHSKKKKGSALSSAASESPKEEGDAVEATDIDPLRKCIKKSSHKQYTVMELFRNRQVPKLHTTHDAMSTKTVSQMLQERRSDGGVSDGGLGQARSVADSGMQVLEVGPDGVMKAPAGWRPGEGMPSSHAEGGRKHMVQKLFVTKDGLVSSVKIEDASERETVQHESLKRKFPGSIVGSTGNSEGTVSKKMRTVEGEGCHSSQQPMVMVVAQHSQNAPGLRSILPKPHMAPTVAVAATSTVPTSTTPVMASAGQKLLLAAPPLLMKPGTKVALVPVSMAGKSSFSIIPATVVPGSKGRAVPVNAVSSLPKVLNLQPSSAGKNTDALRSLLSPSNGPRLKTVSMVPGSIPAAAQRVSVPSSMMSAVSLAQSRVLSGSSYSSFIMSSSSSMSSVSVSHSKSVGSTHPNGLLPVTPPKTPEGEAAAEGMASATAPDSDAIPLCCCKMQGTFFNKLSTGATYCQALDSVDGKALGCCNKVSNLQLVRPGVKIPFMAVCEVHRRRLKTHQCCPGCGHFCTQGKFYQCRQEGATVHTFHRQCQTERVGKMFCPHCGQQSGQVEVTLTLNEPKPSQSSEQIRANLRKSLSKARMMPASVGKKKAQEAKLGVTVTLSDSNKTISSDGLPVGPDRDNLEKLLELCVLKTERPKKYRVLPKNMYQPASEGDMDRVFYMLMDGMDPNQICEEEDNQTVLHAAVYSGNLALVYLLVQAGACLHTPDKSLKTSLMCAAEYGHLAIFQFLAKAGARLDDRGEDRMTCLHCAAKAGHMEIIQYILDIEAIDVNATDEGGWTPLMWATESQLVNVVKYLVSRGGDPNLKDNEENNALHWAAFAGSVEIAELFLDLGCELDTPNEHGDRPLHIAARQDHYEVVVILLARGANVDLKNNKDETPVSCCASANSQVCMALKVNKQLRSFAAKLSRPEKLAHRDLSIGREKNPIACVNAVDDEPCPSDYLYVNHNVETQDLHINNVITSLQSCHCKDDCSSVFCVCSRSSVKCWFDKFGRLLEEFNMLDPPHIFECNRACRCWVNCNNRVVQNGITVRMQVFRTKGRGWGVRSLMDIPKGTFICEYIGELISDQEADRREDDSYLFDLDNKDGDTYCLDARKYGNVARFINHLCEPNLVPVKVFVEHQDLRFPRICFFSSRNIKAYEELGFDYGEKFWIIKWKQFTCACGSPKCKYSMETIKRTLEEYRQRHEDEEQAQDGS
ncbi:uncharacterized protein LOC143276258 isoform X2 [Babylonia areolata]|uniref:uncharacterized protein LOC143276258 isoform X2 n=1 Tax=Babylonia areolata TaxID=304850 RepID=UPI003FD17A8D